MRTILLTLSLSILTSVCAFSQATSGTIDYQKTRQSVAIIRLPIPVNTVEKSLAEYMAKRGAKSANIKGFIVFRSTLLSSTDTTLSDLYFKIERNNRGEKDMSTISLLPAGKNQDLLTRSGIDSGKIEAARSFLDSVAPYIVSYDLQVRIDDQQGVLKKGQKKMNGLISDQADLEKRIRKLNADLDQNRQDQVKATADLQTNINADEDTKRKIQKKIRGLLDDQGSLEKKLRKTQADLDGNKIDQQQQQRDTDNQQQVLQAIKDKKSSS